MTRNRIILVTIGIMLSLFLASMESTVVATAMPTIVGQLGGLEQVSSLKKRINASQRVSRAMMRSPKLSSHWQG